MKTAETCAPAASVIGFRPAKVIVEINPRDADQGQQRNTRQYLNPRPPLQQSRSMNSSRNHARCAWRPAV